MKRNNESPKDHVMVVYSRFLNGGLALTGGGAWATSYHTGSSVYSFTFLLFAVLLVGTSIEYREWNRFFNSLGRGARNSKSLGLIYMSLPALVAIMMNVYFALDFVKFS